MEEIKLRALVMQAADDTALLLCQGGRLIRTKNTLGWIVGEEIFIDTADIINNKGAARKSSDHRFMKIIVKIAACFILVSSGLLASRGIPVHSQQLMDCIEVKTNIYGKVIGAKPISDQGKVILDVIENDQNANEYQTGNVSEYLETIKTIMANLEEGSPISGLANSDDFARYYNNVPEELKQQADAAIASGDQGAIDNASHAIKEQVTRDLYETGNEELQLAYDLFGYKPVREEYYSLGEEGHDLISVDTEHAADIYLPFWSINMQDTGNWGLTNVLTLSFEYPEDAFIPDFTTAKVYLYDLSDNKESTSSVKAIKTGGHDKPEADMNYSTHEVFLLVDHSTMTAYHTYYIKINNVFENEQEIDNICYVFTYIPGGSMGFRYVYVTDAADTSNDTTAENSSEIKSGDTQEQNPVATSDDSEAIVWKDKAVEDIIRQALGKPSGDITKKEAAEYNSWLVLYRDDIKSINDLVWFKNISSLYVRADLIQNASILQPDLEVHVFFNGLTKISDIREYCNIDELNKLPSLGVILRKNGEDCSYKLGDYSVKMKYCNNFEDYSNINVLLDFKNLTDLDMSNSGISDISPLECFSNSITLSDLDLSRNNISDISILKNFINLKYLSIDSNNISNIDSLSGLINLTGLSLSNNKLIDINCISELNLTVLNLSQNNISNIECLKNMKQLEYLYLWHNSISDISSLSNLSSLMQVTLDGNPIIDWSPVENVANVVGRPD